MKKSLFLLTLFFFAWASAHSSVGYFMGMQNNHDAFIGIKVSDSWGFAVDHSVLPQSVQKQHVCFAPFYKFSLLPSLEGYYLLYAGFRYDNQYYDYGAKASLEWKVLDSDFSLLGSFQPFYDSFFGQKNGYGAWMEYAVSPDISLIAGIKNIPENRDVERRYSAKMMFKVPKMLIQPEFSVPTTNNLHKMRVSVFFIYGNNL